MDKIWITLRVQPAAYAAIRVLVVRLVLVAIFSRAKHERTICRQFFFCFVSFRFILVVVVSIRTGFCWPLRRQDVIEGNLQNYILLKQIEPVRPEQKFPNDNEAAHLSIT